MKLEMFTIRDIKADAFLQPFFTPNKAMALRAFGNAINDPKTQFNANPEDYSLYHIGAFDEAVGRVDLLPDPEHLGGGLEFVKSPV